ncbi:MAG: Signal transduction histidine kinase CheA [Firmicutes bacterium]|nr:Signal transduction histidine kinase CheA [Bacillota bacterium]MDI6704692.1 chemotaxis protein CheA [Bacillota bacterium]
MDLNQFMEIFLEESSEHLESLNNSLLELEKTPGDRKLVDEIFRVSHTLKGMAGTMGFNKMAELTHEMENMLDGIRRSNLTVDTAVIDLLFECLDGLQVYVNSIANEGIEGGLDTTALVNRIKKMLNRKEDSEPTEKNCETEKLKLNSHELTVLEKALEQGISGYQIEVKIDPGCMLKAARAFILFNTLEKYGEVIKSEPSVEDIEDEKFKDTIRVVIISKYDSERIAKDVMGISEILDVAIQRIDYETENRENAGEDIKNNDENDYKASAVKKNITGKTVRVDIDRLDNLMNLVSELIIIKTRLEENGSIKENANTNEALEYLERITTNLHDAVMKVRMVPIERVFNRFPRMVRDLSKELGKEINLFMYGEETEVDRTVIDEIGDPLIHLMRNAIDHGIEQAGERVKLQKAKEGKVVLRAYHDGNTVVIEVEDDGKGIDVEGVLRKAVDNGLYTEQQLEKFSSEDIIQLIFEPGFSTAKTISDLSGRGVGLDVVKTKIESLGGLVEVDSKKGIGSKFVIRLPLTLAIIQALLIGLGNENYAIPLNSIKEIVTIKESSVKSVQNKEVVLLRGELLPLVRLDKELGAERETENQQEMTVVVVRKGEKLAGIVVDRLIGQQEIVIKSLGKYLSGIRCIAGATILGDGRVSLILDTNSLF